MAARREMIPERMDDPDVTRAELESSLRFIRRVNARLGGVAALLKNLSRWSRGWDRGRPVTLLDLGTGSADIPVAARRWARARGFDLRVTGVDNHPRTLELAGEFVDASGEGEGIELVRADALGAAERFGPGSFDYAHAGMFLHHFSDAQALTLLRIMDRVARAGIVWNDLLRSRLALIGVHALTLGAPEIVRHDARVSVRKGFTPAEARSMARRLDLDEYCRVRAAPLLGRFTLEGERRDAWPAPRRP